MMKLSYLAALEFITLSLIVTMVAESSPEERQLTMCKKIEVKLRKDKSQITVVDVCQYNRTQFFINPVGVVQLHKPRKVSYYLLSKKYFTNLKMLVSSKYILEQIAGKPEYRGHSVKFAHAKRVRFVCEDEFHDVRKDVHIDAKWKTVDYSAGSDEVFADMAMSTDSLKTMSKLLAGFSEELTRTGENIELESVKAEFDIPEYNYFIGNLKQSVEIQNLGPKILGLLETLDAKNKKQNIMTIISKHPTNALPWIQENEWLLVQRRDTPGVDFNKTWLEYVLGFGNVDSDFWLGLSKLQEVTNRGQYGLRLEFETHRGLQESAEYKLFKIGNVKYKLNISGFDNKSSVGYDKMAWSNSHAFATVDRDTNYSCAKALGGGWWMRPLENHDCVDVHFNNELRSSISHSQACVHYHYFKNEWHSDECLKRTRMYVYRNF